MSQIKPTPTKRNYLRSRRALNPHPGRAKYRRFLEHDFFDPFDLVQVKYEMLRMVKVEGFSITYTTSILGFSRPTYYKALADFTQRGMLGLQPQLQRRPPHKLTPRVVRFLVKALEKDPFLRLCQLVGLIERKFGLEVSPGSILPALRQTAATMASEAPASDRSGFFSRR